ncbi:MAG: hypothetical protein HY738_17375 [Bacteroidia bacterium]|nr:hypothetical protein [Bacteroidia bacterium]
MPKNKNKISTIPSLLAVKTAMRIFLYTLVLIISFSFFAQKIVFVNADLGRHLKNGEIILSTSKVVSTNYYSFTEPDFPVINHHWGSGVLFYLIQKMTGFEGLSFIYCLLSAITVFLFFKIAESKSHMYMAFLFFMLCIPIISNRTEIRPEVFSLLLMAIYTFLLERFLSKKISFKKPLIVLPLLQLLWVNLHIFFVMGLIIIGAYAIHIWSLHKKEGAKQMGLLLGLCVVACFFNPFGIQGALTPLTIFKNYGYMVAENQSVFFIQNRFDSSVYLHYEFITLVAVVVLLFYLKKINLNIQRITPVNTLSIFFVALGYIAIRGIPLAAVFLMAFVPGIVMLLFE